MVMRFGMSDRLGPRVFGHDHGQPFLGREFNSEPDYSDELAREIDDEIRRFVEAAHLRAREILTEHHGELVSISEVLVKRETIEKHEFEALLAGKSEIEVFGEEELAPPSLPEAPPAAERSSGGGAFPLPRPGLAGAEARAVDPPQRPELG
jgi:cell division protease FtsH